MSAPALAVLFIGVGLTLPALVYPISQSRRRRWEARSFVSLEPLWSDLADAMPHIVLPTSEDDGTMERDPGFLLQRRVVEISDGLLELRPYCPLSIQEVAEQNVAVETRPGAAFVEAALAKAALAGLRLGRQPTETATLKIFPRGGDLRDEVDWLVAVAGAYAQGDMLDPVLAAADRAGTSVGA